MSENGFIDPLLPSDLDWANLIDSYGICDLCWGIPYFPGLTSDWDNPLRWHFGPYFLISERFSLPKGLWAENFIPILKNWAFAKNPIYWDILKIRAQKADIKDNEGLLIDPLHFILSDSSLDLTLEGEGDLFISYLYEARTPRYEEMQPMSNAFNGFGCTLENGGIPQAYSVFDQEGSLAEASIKIFPEKTCNPAFKYEFSCTWNENFRYFRQRHRHFRVSGQTRCDLRPRQFSGPLTGTEIQEKIVLGSVVVSGDPAIVEQAKSQLAWYLYDNLYQILDQIDQMVDAEKIISELEAQGVVVSESGHLHKNGCSASLAYGDWVAAGSPPVRWGIVIPKEQVEGIIQAAYYAQEYSYSAWIPPTDDPEITYYLISYVWAGLSPYFWDLYDSPSPEKIAAILDSIRFTSDSLTSGAIKSTYPILWSDALRRTGPFISKWSQYPNYQLEGFEKNALSWASRNYLRDFVLLMYTLQLSSTDPGEEGWILKYSGTLSEQNLIPDPLIHYVLGPQLADTLLDPSYANNQLNCFVHAPFDGRDWIDLEQISFLKEREVIESLFSRQTGLIDPPRLFYPADNDAFFSGAEILSQASLPYRVEWAKRGSNCWQLKHGPTGKNFFLDQIIEQDWAEYYSNSEEINPLPFTGENVEFWLYDQFNKSSELQENWDSAMQPYSYLLYSAINQKVGVGMPIDSPRVIKMAHVWDVDEFAFLPGSSGVKPDRVWTLGKMLEMLTKVMGIRFTPDGAIQSTRQKSVIRNGKDIPAGWPIGQWGINKATGEGSGIGENEPQRGGIKDEECPGIAYKNRSNRFDEDPYSGKVEKILPGDYVLCESLPQYWDQILDDLQHALGWQELGALAIPAADGTEKKATIEGLGAAISEMIFMLSAISQQTAQGQVSSLKNQAMLLELIKALGLPVVSQTFPVDLGFDEEPAYSVPYPGLAEDAPTIGQLFGAVLTNLALVQSSLLSGKSTKAYQDAKKEAEN